MAPPCMFLEVYDVQTEMINKAPFQALKHWSSDKVPLSVPHMVLTQEPMT